MLPDKLEPINWDIKSVKYVREKYKSQLIEQVENQISNQSLRPEDLRSRETIEINTFKSLLTELSVAIWLKGRRNQLEFIPTEPYSYAWDVFALGRRIEIKKFNSANFNISPGRRGGGCVDMHSFETFDVAELLFACKLETKHDIIIKPIFLMTRDSYFNCRVKSEQRPGTFYLQYDNEARINPNSCKVYQ